MSIDLFNVILHQLSKNESEDLVVKLRSHALDNNSATTDLVAELHRVFNAKPAKGFGIFTSDSEFKDRLQAMRSQAEDFYQFSQFCAEKLKNELIKYPFAEEGILVLAEYQSLATHYLMIGLLPMTHSLKVTEGLDVSMTDYLDINHMDIVARIDISCYESDPESNRYLSFIKGRVGRKVADFFLDFLQADVGLDTKKQNKVLMQAVDDFCTDAKLEKDETIKYKKQVYDYCNDQLKAGDEVSVKALSDELPASDNGIRFADFTVSQGYELDDSFPVDRSTVRTLTKFVGAGGGLNISFDSALLGERIIYDPETDTLTIKGTPPNLKHQLTKNA